MAESQEQSEERDRAPRRDQYRIILLLLGCVIAAVCVALLWRGKKEPQYKGRTLTQWVLLYERSTGAEASHNSYYNPSALRESEEAIHHIGTNALPCLIKWIQCVPSRSRWRRRAADALDKLPGELWDRPPIDSLLNDPAQVHLDVAATCFWLLGTNASAAVPELTRLANDQKSPRASEAALNALAHADQDGLPHVLAILANPNAPGRADAAGCARSASRLGTNASLAVRLLSECVRNQDQQLAISASESLRDLTLEPGITVPALTKGLQDPRRRVRFVCARSLVVCARSVAWLGELKRCSAPALMVALQDPDWQVRVFVTNALSKIAPEVLEPMTSQIDGKH